MRLPGDYSPALQMGFKDRIAAEDAKRVERAKRDKEWARRAEEETRRHVTAAEAMLPEVDEAVAMLRSRRDTSIAAVEQADVRARRAIGLRWTNRKGEPISDPGPSASRHELRKWENRTFAGWVVRLDEGSTQETCRSARGVFIPLEGEPFVESDSPSASAALRDYVGGGRWSWRERMQYSNTGVVNRQEHADTTVKVLLEELAEHLAAIG